MSIHLHFQIYFGVSSVTISLFLYDERRYLSGDSVAPEEMSFIGNTPSKDGLIKYKSQIHLDIYSHCDIQHLTTALCLVRGVCVLVHARGPCYWLSAVAFTMDNHNGCWYNCGSFAFLLCHRFWKGNIAFIMCMS